MPKESSIAPLLGEGLEAISLTLTFNAEDVEDLVVCRMSGTDGLGQVLADVDEFIIVAVDWRHLLHSQALVACVEWMHA